MTFKEEYVSFTKTQPTDSNVELLSFLDGKTKEEFINQCPHSIWLWDMIKDKTKIIELLSEHSKDLVVDKNYKKVHPFIWTKEEREQELLKLKDSGEYNFLTFFNSLYPGKSLSILKQYLCSY